MSHRVLKIVAAATLAAATTPTTQETIPEPEAAPETLNSPVSYSNENMMQHASSADAVEQFPQFQGEDVAAVPDVTDVIEMPVVEGATASSSTAQTLVPTSQSIRAFHPSLRVASQRPQRTLVLPNRPASTTVQKVPSYNIHWDNPMAITPNAFLKYAKHNILHMPPTVNMRQTPNTYVKTGQAQWRLPTTTVVAQNKPQATVTGGGDTRVAHEVSKDGQSEMKSVTKRSGFMMKSVAPTAQPSMGWRAPPRYMLPPTTATLQQVEAREAVAAEAAAQQEEEQEVQEKVAALEEAILDAVDDAVAREEMYEEAMDGEPVPAVQSQAQAARPITLFRAPAPRSFSLQSRPATTIYRTALSRPAVTQVPTVTTAHPRMRSAPSLHHMRPITMPKEAVIAAQYDGGILGFEAALKGLTDNEAATALVTAHVVVKPSQMVMGTVSKELLEAESGDKVSLAIDTAGRDGGSSNPVYLEDRVSMKELYTASPTVRAPFGTNNVAVVPATSEFDAHKAGRFNMLYWRVPVSKINVRESGIYVDEVGPLRIMPLLSSVGESRMTNL